MSASPASRIPDAIFGKAEKAIRSANMKAIKDDTKAALIAELGEGKFTDVDLNVVFEDLQYKAYRRTVLERGALRRPRCKESAADRLRGRRPAHGSTEARSSSAETPRPW